MTNDTQYTSTSQKPTTVAQFFESTPPGQEVYSEAFAKHIGTGVGNERRLLHVPEIKLFCDDDACNGVRFFSSSQVPILKPDELSEHFITFRCRNCARTTKRFAFFAVLYKDGKNGTLFKLGEYPPFGPPTPSRVTSLVGSEREYFFKGRRSESQGLGIAAFAYYRRVVENKKTEIIEEILRVARKVAASPDVIGDLEAAKVETQFSTAIEKVKHGVPESLQINGQNPLRLLHSALSEGLHAQTDAQCLELAQSIRVVLTELVERIAGALKDEKELNDAVSRLLSVSAKKAERSGDPS
jgi:hypothetical protein